MSFANLTTLWFNNISAYNKATPKDGLATLGEGVCGLKPTWLHETAAPRTLQNTR